MTTVALGGGAAAKSDRGNTANCDGEDEQKNGQGDMDGHFLKNRPTATRDDRDDRVCPRTAGSATTEDGGGRARRQPLR